MHRDEVLFILQYEAPMPRVSRHAGCALVQHKERRLRLNHSSIAFKKGCKNRAFDPVESVVIARFLIPSSFSDER